MTENNHNNNQPTNNQEESRRVKRESDLFLLSHDLSWLSSLCQEEGRGGREPVSCTLSSIHALNTIITCEWEERERSLLPLVVGGLSSFLPAASERERDFSMSLCLSPPSIVQIELEAKEITTRHLHNHREGRKIKKRGWWIECSLPTPWFD